MTKKHDTHTKKNENKKMFVQTAAADLCRGSMYTVSRCLKTLLLNYPEAPETSPPDKETGQLLSCRFFFLVRRNKKGNLTACHQLCSSSAPPTPPPPSANSRRHCFLIAGMSGLWPPRSAAADHRQTDVIRKHLHTCYGRYGILVYTFYLNFE